MNKNYLSLVLITSTVFLAGCGTSTRQPVTPTPVPPVTPEVVEPTMSEADARLIADSDCIKEGETLDAGTYNENSKTWWFDAHLSEPKEGCNPACVIWTETGVAEINWRCTGAIMENEDIVPELTALFIAKNPKYKDTLMVRVNQQTETHARGDVIFVEGMPGGYFLAVKVDGVWTIALEGNGGIPCTLMSEQGFPEDMITDCYTQ